MTPPPPVSPALAGGADQSTFRTLRELCPAVGDFCDVCCVYSGSKTWAQCLSLLFRCPKPLLFFFSAGLFGARSDAVILKLCAERRLLSHLPTKLPVCFSSQEVPPFSEAMRERFVIAIISGTAS